MNQSEKKELSRHMALLAMGDRGAFETVFTLAWPVLRSFSTKFLGSPSDGEDAAQEALLKIFGRAAQYRPDLDALAWMLTLTAFECRTLRQKKRRRKEENIEEGSTMNSLKSETNDPEAEILKDQLQKALDDALSTLSDSDRETIMISILDKDRPDIPAATFRKRLERALSRFKEVWGEKYEA